MAVAVKRRKWSGELVLRYRQGSIQANIRQSVPRVALVLLCDTFDSINFFSSQSNAENLQILLHVHFVRGTS